MADVIQRGGIKRDVRKDSAEWMIIEVINEKSDDTLAMSTMKSSNNVQICMLL